MTRRSRFFAGALALVSVLGLVETSARAEESTSLVAALEELRDSGLSIIYSSDLVRPDMEVAAPPTAATLHGTLRDLLSPHGLAAAVGPGGTVLVVRDPDAPMRVEIESPLAGQTIFGKVHLTARVEAPGRVSRVEFLLDGDVIATRLQPPWEAWVNAGQDNRDRRFSVVAHARQGETVEDSVVTLKVPVDESYFVTLRELSVTVSKDRRRVVGLEREAFRLVDGDVQQEIVTFESGELPVTAVLLIDASESMRGEPLAAALEGARAFLGQLRAKDRSMVILFSDRALAVSPMMTGEHRLPASFREVDANGSTALNDHLFAALEVLGRHPGRRVAVLFSDGADVVSVLDMRDVLWKVRRSDAMIYWIQLAKSSEGASFTSSWRGTEENRQEWHGLELAVDESGGRIERIEQVGKIAAAFDSVLEELRQQYVLGYYPQGRTADGTWRRVRVRVDLPGARVRVRSGYVDDRS